MIEVMERIDTRSFCATPEEPSPKHDVEPRGRQPGRSGGRGHGKRVPMLPWSQTLFSDNVSAVELMAEDFAHTADPSSLSRGMPRGKEGYLPTSFWIG
jgi:hypothetical protein